MTARLAHIYRHPIKSHGREALAQARLTKGACLPWDRRWAVTHERSKWRPESPGWLACVNFLIGSGTPELMAINAGTDEATGEVSLYHPSFEPLTFSPDTSADQTRFLQWIAQILPESRLATGIVKAPDRGMTDTDYPSVSMCNLASNSDLAMTMNAELSPLRWRGNLWVEGWLPWVECDLVGQDIRVGSAVLHIQEGIKRCKATTVNPLTGLSDVDTLHGLRSHTGNQEFGIYAKVIQGGTISVGDAVEILG